MSYDFEPRPLRLRVWTGRTMWHPHEVPGDPRAVPHVVVHVGEQTRAVLNDRYSDQYGRFNERELEGAVIMQSTGLRDADGREVWEGDVVEWERKFTISGRRGVVEMFEGTWRVSVTPLSTYDDENRPPFRVVGHVFEPETQPLAPQRPPP